MNNIILYIFLFLNINYLFAQQNLIPNPSFEDYWQCPNANELGDGEFTKCKYWWYPTPSFLGSPDYFNRCNNLITNQIVGIPDNFWGHQEAFHGDGYVGLLPIEYSLITTEIVGMEFVSCKLLEQLKPCFEYNFSMRISLGNESSHSIQKMGILLTRDSLRFFSLDDVYNQKPSWENSTQIDDTINWMKIEGNFIATGGEQYLTIGYFNDFDSDEWLFIDSNNINIFNSIAPYYYIDSVSLTEIEEEDDCNIILPNIFTPNGDGVNDYFKINGLQNGDKVSVFNRWGQLIFKTEETNVFWDGMASNGTKCSEGAYYYIIEQKKSKETKTGILHLKR